MSKYAFIQENSHTPKIKALLISGSILIILVFLALFLVMKWNFVIGRFPLVEHVTSGIENRIVNFTPSGLFYTNFIGGLFFIPTPDEILFYYWIGKGSPVVYLIFLAILGYSLAQVINYYLGLKLSPFILHFVSKDKVYNTRRFVNKYGAYGIFLFNFLPLPSPLLTFALGIAKYNFSRLFFITLIGKTCKFLVIALIYSIVSGYYL